MQESCLRLMGKKLLVALAMEGKFSSDGLQAMDDGGDILMALARELVTEKNIGESADSVWKAVQQQHQALAAHVPQPKTLEEVRIVPVEPSSPVNESADWLTPDSVRLSSARESSKKVELADAQLTLF
jgi:hypothetical protein